MPSLVYESVITCPHCRFASAESMSAVRTVFSYRCRDCGAILYAQGDDCCVFCSYGSVPCPPVQQLEAYLGSK